MSARRSTLINQALLGISRRAENASIDRHTLARTFVTAGSLSAMLHSADHQILYGRRGTGKTHALLYLSDVIERSGDVPIYLDLRSIGATGGDISDVNIPVSQRGTYLVVDTLEAIHGALLAHAIDNDGPRADELLRALDALAEAASAVEVVGEVESETTVGGARVARSSSGLSVSARANGFALKADAIDSREKWVNAENRMRRTGVEQHRVVFGQLHRALREISEALAPARLWLLLDEWSSVPYELQPLVADMLRRAVLPTQNVSVKIAAVERRSHFRQTIPSGEYVGIEVGADAASAVSLDDLMNFHDNPKQAQRFFQQLFFNHARTRLPEEIAEQCGNPSAFAQAAFKKNAFTELVRAAEGVPRDAINVAAMAAQLANNEQISIKHVRTAARDWYLRDKQQAINSSVPAREVLRGLIDEVVGRRRMRTFLLEQFTDAQHETIQDLCDARLLHVLQRGVSDRRRPGTLYDGFAIDYGCYVALLLDGGFQFNGGNDDRRVGAAKRVPQEDFNPQHCVIDLASLRTRGAR